jgi:N6-L-threonylcarbamoyladenine synthase
MKAAKMKNCDVITLAGGVASNSRLREALQEECNKYNYKFSKPSPIFCTDNGAMIGVCGYYKYLKNQFSNSTLNAMPNLEFSN